PIDGDITLSLNIDAVTSDNIINIAEAGSASVTVTGSALGDFTAGETVTVTLSNGVSRSATLSATGTWSVSFAGSDLAASTSITATSTATDAAGNSVTLSDVQTYTVDLTPPSAPLIIAANGAVVSGSGEIGSSISLLGAGGTVLATTVVGGDGRWSIAASAVASGLNGFSGTVQAADPAGNT
ncbi:Ig-like domain-containing protein, partial [Brevundimonas staleyi]